MLYHRLQTLAGVSFHRQSLFPDEYLYVSEPERGAPLPPQAHFVDSDLIGLHARGKFTYTIPRIEADTAVELARRSHDVIDMER
jgi:hypothetical protein